MKLDERQFPNLSFFENTGIEAVWVFDDVFELGYVHNLNPKTRVGPDFKSSAGWSLHGSNCTFCDTEVIYLVKLYWRQSLGVLKQRVQMSKLPFFPGFEFDGCHSDSQRWLYVRRRQGYIQQKGLCQPPFWDCSKGWEHFPICIPTYHSSCRWYEWYLVWRGPVARSSIPPPLALCQRHLGSQFLKKCAWCAKIIASASLGFAKNI